MASATSSRTVLRADIQVLRAVAALLVLGFHFWQNLLPGGFVGVDIFFVISGFLITTHLFGETARHGTVRLRTFWARRARRLLPSAYLVILVTSVLVFAFQPSAMWPAFVKQAIASTFYYENWALAADSTNYLAADKPPTAVQQYWSLSAEEQFYIVWPVLILLAVLIARAFKRTSSVRAMAYVLGVVTVASFAYSVIAVWRGESIAYFSTFSRAWEFGLGGLIAVWMSHRAATVPDAPLVVSSRWRPILSIAGWAGIVASIFFINLATPFPGLWALLPAASTAAVILARWQLPVAAPMRAPLAAAMWLGGISYAIYLWHWPLIVIYPYAMHSEPTLLPKIGLLVATVVLAWLTTRFVETPIRTWSFLNNGKNWRTAVLVVGCAAIVIAPAITASTIQTTTATENAKKGAVLAANDCFGAGTIDYPAECATKTWPLLQPDPAMAIDDRSVLYTQKCISETAELITCHFGTTGAKYRVALIGDSHAASWFPAVEKAFAGKSVEITSYTKFSCVYSSAPRSKVYEACTTWGKKLSAELASAAPYDLVIVTGYATNLAQDIANRVLTAEQAQQGFADVWAPLVARGSQVVVVHDNPEWPQTPSNCLTSGKKPDQCVATQKSVYSVTDYQYASAHNVAGVTPMNFDDYFCAAGSCFSAVGGATIYLDRSHISATYARSMGPAFAAKLAALK